MARTSLPSFAVQLASPRVTTAIAAGGVLWALRAPAGKTVIVRGGVVRLALDTALGTLAEVGVELVRFSGADPGGGTLLVAESKLASQAPATTAIRAAGAGAGLTMTGTTVAATTKALATAKITGNANSSGQLGLEALTDLELAAGEGLACRTNPAAWPVGAVLSGLLEFAER